MRWGIILIIFVSCNPNKVIDLHSLIKSELSFNELPKEVQYTMLSIGIPQQFQNENGLISSRIPYEYRNLDSISVTMKYEYIPGNFMGSNASDIFIIDERKFELSWNRNRETAPFILYNKKLYYSIELNTIDSFRIMNSKYEYINLEKYLSY